MSAASAQHPTTMTATLEESASNSTPTVVSAATGQEIIRTLACCMSGDPHRIKRRDVKRAPQQHAPREQAHELYRFAPATQPHAQGTQLKIAPQWQHVQLVQVEDREPALHLLERACLRQQNLQALRCGPHREH